jgi:hypothetical protein
LIDLTRFGGPVEVAEKINDRPVLEEARQDTRRTRRGRCFDRLNSLGLALSEAQGAWRLRRRLDVDMCEPSEQEGCGAGQYGVHADQRNNAQTS